MRVLQETKDAKTMATPEYRLVIVSAQATSSQYILQPFVERWHSAGVKWVRIWLDNYSFVVQSGANGGTVAIGFQMNEFSEREISSDNTKMLYTLCAYVQPNYYLQGVSSKMDAYIDVPTSSLTNSLYTTMVTTNVAGLTINGYTLALRFEPLDQ